MPAKKKTAWEAKVHEEAKKLGLPPAKLKKAVEVEMIQAVATRIARKAIHEIESAGMPNAIPIVSS